MLPDYANISVGDAQVQQAADFYYSQTGLRDHLTLENAMVADGTGAMYYFVGLKRDARSILEFRSKTDNITWYTNDFRGKREEVPVTMYALQFRSQNESCGVYISYYDTEHTFFQGKMTADNCYELVEEHVVPEGGNTNGAFRRIRFTDYVPSI